MSDTDAAAAPGQHDGPNMNIDAQYLKDLSFENPGVPDSLRADQPPPDISVSVDVGARQVGEQQFEVELS